MKFTVERSALVKLLKAVAIKSPLLEGKDEWVRLSARAPRVFVEANGSMAGTDALVMEDGTCLLRHDVFARLLRTYAPKANITIEADEKAISFGSTRLPIREGSPAALPPGASSNAFVAAGRRPVR